MFLEIVACLGIVLLFLIFKQLQQISSAITRVHHQLEYIGAPLELVNANWRSEGLSAVERLKLKPTPRHYS
jgi:hypothetical protein